MNESDFVLEGKLLGCWTLREIKKYLKRHKKKIELTCLKNLTQYDVDFVKVISDKVNLFFTTEFKYKGEVVIYNKFDK